LNAPQSLKAITNLQGGQLDFELQSKGVINRVHFSATVIVTSTSMTAGTARVSAGLQSIKLFRGAKDKKGTDPDVEIDNALLGFAAMASSVRKCGRTPTAFVNPAVAAEATTYVAEFDVYVNLAPGPWYVTVDVNSSAAYFDGTHAITAMTVSVAVALDDGYAVIKPEKMLVSGVTLTDFVSSMPATEIFIEGPTTIDFSTAGIVNSFLFDEALSASALSILEYLTAARVNGAYSAKSFTDAEAIATSYGVYKCTYLPTLLKVSFGASRAIKVMLVS